MKNVEFFFTLISRTRDLIKRLMQLADTNMLFIHVHVAQLIDSNFPTRSLFSSKHIKADVMLSIFNKIKNKIKFEVGTLFFV
jgi:hypothetical protein